jgi:hypothetical protein
MEMISSRDRKFISFTRKRSDSCVRSSSDNYFSPKIFWNTLVRGIIPLTGRISRSGVFEDYPLFFTLIEHFYPFISKKTI